MDLKQKRDLPRSILTILLALMLGLGALPAIGFFVFYIGNTGLFNIRNSTYERLFALCCIVWLVATVIAFNAVSKNQLQIKSLIGLLVSFTIPIILGILVFVGINNNGHSLGTLLTGKDYLEFFMMIILYFVSLFVVWKYVQDRT